MDSDESSYPGQLADSDLDWLLTRANKDLLAHIEAGVDATSTLAGIMARSTPAEPGGNPATIAANGFWGSLNADQKRVFTAMAHKRVFASGAQLMHEGEVADHVAVILSGLTQIRVRENDAEQVVAERGPGQLIGERAALQVSVRSATVIALQPVVALVMRTADFAAFISTYPTVLKIIEEQIYARLREGQARYEPRPPRLTGQNCTVVRTDVVAFGADARNDEGRRIIRRASLAMTREALGPVWDACRWEDRGDGLLIIVAPSIPTAEVIDRLLEVLPHQLKRHNRIYSDPIRIKLRIAVEVGPIEEDEVGMSGKPIIQASRMLDAPPFKQAIVDFGAILGIIVSPFVYETQVGPGAGGLDPADYGKVPVQVKETCTSAWMQLIDPFGTVPPSRELLRGK